MSWDGGRRIIHMLSRPYRLEWIDRADFDPGTETLIAPTGEKAHHFGRFHIARRMNVSSSCAGRPKVACTGFAGDHPRPVLTSCGESKGKREVTSSAASFTTETVGFSGADHPYGLLRTPVGLGSSIPPATTVASQGGN